MVRTETRFRRAKARWRPVRTYSPKSGEIERTWHVIDAADVVLGRLASHAAVLLRGNEKVQVVGIFEEQARSTVAVCS